MSAEWSRFNSQFRETEWERQERRRKTREQRRAEGKCWQCAKPVEVCDCPNITHPKPPVQP